MRRIKLLLDEDVWPNLVESLRQAGYDAISVHEIERQGLSDEEQLSFAIAQDRAIISHNIRDFAPLARLCAEQGVSHPGIIVAAQFEKGTLIRRTLTLLDSLTAEQLQDTLRFI